MRGRTRIGGGLLALMIAGLGGVHAAQKAKPAPRRPQLWAVVVGIDKYSDPSIPDTRSAVRDAGAVLGWFLGAGGWDREHVLYMADLGSRNPGRVDAPRPNILPNQDNLDWAFKNWLPSKSLQPGDLVVFYYAGRVGRIAPPPGADTQAQHVLLPSDANLGNVAATGWSLERVIDRLVLETQGQCQVVCWLATSAAGVTPPGGKPLAEAPGAPIPGAVDWLGRLTRWPHVTAWLASDRPPGNVAQEGPGALFTRSLLDSFGRGTGKPGLAASLRALQNNPTLKLQGFRSMGLVPPRLTLWADKFGNPAELRPEIVLQLGHADRVTALVASADGQRVITAAKDSTVRAWSLKDRNLVRTLTGHEIGVNALALSADGRWLISGGSRPVNGVLVHDLTHDFRRSVPDQPHEQRVDRVVMLPDGDHFISTDLSARSYLWDLRESPPTSLPWLREVDCLAVVCGGDAARGKVVALCGDRSVRIFNATGTDAGLQSRWADQPTTLAVDPSGRWLAVGFDNGRVVVRDLESGTETERRVPAGSVGQLAISPQGRLAVGHGGGLSVFLALGDRPPADAGERTMTPQPNARPVFSADGLSLAASFSDAPGLLVWRVDGGEPRLTVDDPQADVSAVAFIGDGRSLATGGVTGSVKIWPLEAARGEASWTFPPNQSRVERLSLSPSRRYLLMLNDLGQARLWDIKDRTCRRLTGAWNSGAFAGDDQVLILAERPSDAQPGRVVNVRVNDGQVAVDPAFFKRTAEGFEVPGDTMFEGLTVSPDGSRVAATANPSQDPLVCVWETRTGRLTHRVTGARLDNPARSLGFSTDARYLITAGDSPEARLWELPAAGGEPLAPTVTFRDAGAKARNISSVAIRPGDARQVVTGHRDGAVRLWKWGDGQAGPPIDLAPNFFPGAVKALEFAVDGPDHYLAAAGDGTSLWVARFSGPRPERINLGPRPHHAEQVNTLASWPSNARGQSRAATLISGSNDTTVKFWEIKGDTLALRGTFATTAGPGDDHEPPAGPPAAADIDWVLFTPEGRFDASPHGRELIRFSQGDRAHPMEQFEATERFAFDLGERILDGKSDGAMATLDEPPPILVEPVSAADPKQPEAVLTIRLGSSQLKDVRLFQNDAPIGTELEAASDRRGKAGAGSITVPVRLVKGTNRFHALASYRGREQVFESRSPDMDLSFQGDEEPGRLHVLALGVGDYRRNRLKYVSHDAERLSEVLHERGLEVAGKKGLRILRTDDEVTNEGVNEDFRTLARESRPQDTVVVFLAGHTGVFGANQFCLLLPSFPFANEAPNEARQRDLVAARDAPNVEATPGRVLPYAVIEANLMRLNALKRLVIVDACQADAIFDDTQVKQIRKWMEIGSRRARTSYLMAARRGEPALEVEGLRHGLFTYTLLRGMGAGAIDRDLEPREITELKLPDDADFDHDGVITTGELERYARLALPPIARIFPHLVSRNLEEIARSRPNLPRIDEQKLQQGLRMQTASDSFVLLPLAR